MIKKLKHKQEEYDGFKQKALKRIMKYFEENESVDPVLFLKNKNGINKAVPLPPFMFASDFGKVTCSHLMKKILTVAGANMCCFITEAWQAKVKEDELPEELDIPVRDRSDKKEILMLNFMHNDLEEEFMTFEIKREEDHPPTLEPSMIQSGFINEGKFDNLFNKSK
jgi:hypothetical protein